jgi:hypothetical protein
MARLLDPKRVRIEMELSLARVQFDDADHEVGPSRRETGQIQMIADGAETAREARPRDDGEHVDCLMQGRLRFKKRRPEFSRDSAP